MILLQADTVYLTRSHSILAQSY